MNKKEIIKFIFVLLAAVISFDFMIKTEEVGLNSMFNIVNVIDFFFALTIFMFYNMKKIKRYKFIYDVTLMLLMVFSAALVIYFLYSLISCFISINCSMENTTFFIILYPTILFLMLLFSFSNIFDKTNKINCILTIGVSIIIILIHLRYYFDPNFANNLIDGSEGTKYSYIYIIQNYIYFTIMYIIVLIHEAINKAS
jgi:hypothetical protein